MKSALITGAAGQDGILLSQLLVADGYRVVGMIKPGMSGAVPARLRPAASTSSTATSPTATACGT